MMNSRYLKIIAVITMTVDHVGHLLFPNVRALRIIGRIAMPLFCLLIAYGITKTRSAWKYFLRLFGFAVAVQIFFNLYIEGDLFAFYSWNVFFTLSFGVAAASLLKIVITMATDEAEMPLGRFCGMAGILLGSMAIVVSASFLPIDYGSAGVLLVLMFYAALRHSVTTLKITAAASLAVFNFLLADITWSLQWYSLLALPFIFLFIDRKLSISAFEKYAFYVYYPLHFAVIYFVGTLL